MNKTKSYLFSFFLGILTVIICLAIGDGLIGVAGTLGECVYDESGELIEYTLHVKDPTGKIIFWSGLLLLPVILAYWIRPRYTWINLPLFVLSWYILSAIFGSHANHYFLAHPARGFISFFEEFDPFIVAVFMWLTQLIVLLVVRGIIKLIRKIKTRKDTTT
ncbi:MAG: hypothetical protein IKC03_01180 [Oscillospiraceae bacterium]|nr:hypothetical protein [Oscillospiraceae bacterium]